MSRAIGIVSGKGGVGKTVTAINLAAALNLIGKDVLLVDANISTPNIHIHFGAKDIQESFTDVLKSEKNFFDVIHTHKSGLQVLPSLTSFDDLRYLDYKKLTSVIKNLKDFSEITIVDCGSGLNDESISAIEACDEIIVVANPEEVSVDISKKVVDIANFLNKTVLGVVLNKVKNKKYELSDIEVSEVLRQPVLFKIPFDNAVKKSFIAKNPVVNSYPRSKISKSFNSLANYLV